MSPAKPTVPEEREQGAVKAQEELEAGAVVPAEGTPAEQEEAAIESAVAQAEPVAQGEQQAPTGQQGGYTIRNPHMLLPSGANFARANGPRGKTPTEAAYDAGLLLDVLGRDDPVFAQISKELKKA